MANERKKLKNKIAKYTLLSMAMSAIIMIGLAFVILNNLSKGNFTMGQSAVLMIIAGSFVCILATLILNGFISRITKPIIDIAQEVKLLQQGNFSSDFKIHADDTEIGEMVENIAAMKKSLKDVIIDITYCCTELSQGNFMVETSAEYSGDLSRLKGALSITIDTLRSLVSQVGSAAELVSVGSDQVSLGAQAVSQGTMQQASAIQQLSASIIEVSESVKNSANGAASAEQLTNKVNEEMNVSDQNMKKMVAAMQEISDSSSEIGKIIKAIEDIAFQTNILALNAAVEAARAGAAGKGFAVVADEVRNLATKSAEAAKDTTSLIEHSIFAVENGTMIANATATSLQAVVEGTKELIGQIDIIAKEAKEQDASIREITQGVDQVSGVVQTNSATAEESAATSEELSGQASMLKELVSKFKVNTPKVAQDHFAIHNAKEKEKIKPVSMSPKADKSKIKPMPVEIMQNKEEIVPVQPEIPAYTPRPMTKTESVSKSPLASKREMVSETKASIAPKSEISSIRKPKVERERLEATNGKTINDHSDKY